MLVVCSNLNQLAQTTLSAKYFPLVLYTICMLIEIFIYCWFGNEVKLKVPSIHILMKINVSIFLHDHTIIHKYYFITYLQSFQMIDHIFEINWLELNINFKKAFVMIMNRATTPIEFTSAYIFSMNLESFVGVNINFIIFVILLIKCRSYIFFLIIVYICILMHMFAN